MGATGGCGLHQGRCFGDSSCRPGRLFGGGCSGLWRLVCRLGHHAIDQNAGPVQLAQHLHAEFRQPPARARLTGRVVTEFARVLPQRDHPQADAGCHAEYAERIAKPVAAVGAHQ